MRLALAFLSFVLLSFLLPERGHAAPSYTVKTLEQIALWPRVQVAARVVAENESRIAAEVGARIEKIAVGVGARVKKGQVLVRLDRSQYELALDQARAQVELLQNRYKLAQLQFEQARSLHASNFLSAQAMEQRRTELAVLDSELKIARNGVEQARLNLRRTTIEAPFDGVVRERLAGEGELAAPGAPLLTLVEDARNEVRARVPQRDIGSLRKARELVFREGGQAWPLELVRIAPVVDARAQTREVVLRAGQSLIPGAAGELTWRSDVPHLAADYVLQHEGRLGVWVEEAGKPVFKPLPQAQAGRPVALDWPLTTRIIDEGRFALGGAVQPATASR